ncbi:MAG: TonB-dependent receptor [Bradyrhizobiaceae bacterium]|nr:MAG: TonB-dependent receptor [Bradyrhizobiaceae bacterium]
MHGMCCVRAAIGAISMFRRHIVYLGIFAIAVLGDTALHGDALAAPPDSNQVLPPVTVESPKPRPVPSPRTPAQRTAASGTHRRKPATTRQPLAPVVASDTRGSGPTSAGNPPIKDRYQLPQTSESATAERIREQVNALDSADMIKYFPSLFVRKRNYGDNQAVLATRTSGLGASARSLVYADDILLSSLIANNNTLGVPQWNMVSPEAIKRVDFLYGPFSAAYPGNSEGGVLIYTTKMPEKFEMTAKQTEAFQTFDRYDTKGTYRTDQTSVSIGDKLDRFSYFISGSYQNSYSQPLAWVTTGSNLPAGVTGAIPQSGRIPNTRADVVGAGGLLHTEQETVNGKFAYDVTPWIKATYTMGLWNNDENSSVQSYLRTASGAPTFGNVSGFASNNFNWNQTHMANAVSLKSDTKGLYDFDVSLSRVDFLQDIQRLPFGVVANSASFTPYGKIARLDGTNWMNGDANFIWRPGSHEVSFGFHGDVYELNNPTYQTSNWTGGPDSSNTLYSSGRGKTSTLALWAQDAWRFAPDWKLTTGVRLEDWSAFDGFNLFAKTNSDGSLNGSPVIKYQPDLSSAKVSPKLSLAYEPNKAWLVTASIGQASRFPTVAELYQIVTAGNLTVIPNPNLKPEDVLSEEIAIERRFTDGKVRLSFFNENSHNTLISQLSSTTATNGTITNATFTSNVDKTRTTGIELAAQKDNVLIDRLEVFGSITWADARIVSDPTFVSTTGTTADGKRIPNIPEWRVTSGMTYRPDDLWAYTVAVRYASKQYTTLDNTDTVKNVFTAFDSYTVVDLRVQRKVTDNVTASFGIDNVNNAKYTLYHPFPERTYVADLRVKF